MFRHWWPTYRAISSLGLVLVLAGTAAVVASYVNQEEDTNAYKSKKRKSNGYKSTALLPDDPVQLVPYLPSKLPLFGNMLQLATNAHRFHDWLTEQCIAHKGKFQLALPGQNNLIVTAVPEHYEDVVKTHFSHFRKGQQQYDMFVDLMGHSVLIIEGDEWRAQRRLLVRLFTTRALRDHMVPVIQKHTLLLQNVLFSAAKANHPVDLYMLLHRFTFKAFSDMVFHNALESLDAEHEHPFERAFDEAQSIVANRLQQPVWLWKLKRWLNVGQERTLGEDLALIDDFMLHLISLAIAKRQQRQQEQQAGNPVPPLDHDIVSIILECKEQDGEHISPRDVRNLAVAALGAGRDTSADTMSWLLHTLTQHRQVQAKLRTEVLMHVPQVATDRSYVPSMDQVQGLVYLEATIRELLRLHPPVPFTLRECIQDTVLSDGTFVPKGTNIGMCHYGTARRPEVWGPDATEFKPERFIDKETGKLLATPFAKFNAFSGGQRVCVGKALAMLEMKIVIATLVGRFYWDEVPGQTVEYAMGITIGMKSSLMMHIHPVET